MTKKQFDRAVQEVKLHNSIIIKTNITTIHIVVSWLLWLWPSGERPSEAGGTGCDQVHVHGLDGPEEHEQQHGEDAQPANYDPHLLDKGCLGPDGWRLRLHLPCRQLCSLLCSYLATQWVRWSHFILLALNEYYNLDYLVVANYIEPSCTDHTSPQCLLTYIPTWHHIHLILTAFSSSDSFQCSHSNLNSLTLSHHPL